MIRKISIILLVLLTCVFASVFAQDSSSLSQKGNELYRRRDFDGALKFYNEALIKEPESAYVQFNIGTAQLKKGDFEKAISSFEKAMLSDDKKLEVKANYNTAYVKYKLGKLKENTDLSKTVELLRQSLDYYKRTIELDPKDKKAKVNHELVERELKVLLDKLKQQQEQKEKQQKEEKARQDKQKEQEKAQADKGQSQGSQEQKQESGQQQSEQQQAQSQEVKEEQAQVQEENKEEAKTAEDQKKEGSNAQELKEGQEEKEQLKDAQKAQEQQESSTEKKEMSKEEANVLLEDFKQEDNMFGNINDNRQGNISEVLKDW